MTVPNLNSIGHISPEAAYLLTVDQIKDRMNFALTITNIYTELMRIMAEASVEIDGGPADFETLMLICILSYETFNGRAIRKTALANSLRLSRTTANRKLQRLIAIGLVHETKGKLTWHPTPETAAAGEKVMASLRACVVRLYNRDPALYGFEIGAGK